MSSETLSSNFRLNDNVRQTLRIIGAYHFFRKDMKKAAVGSFIFGTIDCLAALAGSPSALMFNTILGVLGVCLLISGLWLLVWPRSSAFIIYGGGLIFVGLWNLGIPLLSMTRGHAGGPHWLVLGVSQLGWGIREMRKAPRFKRLANIAENRFILDSIATNISESIPQGDQIWTLRIPSRSRPMACRDVEAPLKSHITRLLTGKLPQDRAVLLRPGSNKFQYLRDVSELDDTLALLNQEPPEEN